MPKRFSIASEGDQSCFVTMQYHSGEPSKMAVPTSIENLLGAFKLLFSDADERNAEHEGVRVQITNEDQVWIMIGPEKRSMSVRMAMQFVVEASP